MGEGDLPHLWLAVLVAMVMGMGNLGLHNKREPFGSLFLYTNIKCKM
jgi:hypothetical protein